MVVVVVALVWKKALVLVLAWSARTEVPGSVPATSKSFTAIPIINFWLYSFKWNI